MSGVQRDIEIIQDRDVAVRMRDGVHLSVDVYRPAGQGRYPVLYASALHNKDMQVPEIAEVLPPQPAFAPLRHRRNDGGRIHPVSRRHEPGGRSQDLSRCEAPVAPAASNHSQGMSVDPIRQLPL
jgi:hypothetical protein